jgi:hypothetical protein
VVVQGAGTPCLCEVSPAPGRQACHKLSGRCSAPLPLLRRPCSLANFAYVGRDGKDHGVNVRIRAGAVAALVEDGEELAAQRDALAARAAAFLWVPALLPACLGWLPALAAVMMPHAMAPAER